MKHEIDIPDSEWQKDGDGLLRVVIYVNGIGVHLEAHGVTTETDDAGTTQVSDGADSDYDALNSAFVVENAQQTIEIAGKDYVLLRRLSVNEMKLLTLTDSELAHLLEAIDSHVQFPRGDLEPSERKEMIAAYDALDAKLRAAIPERDGERCETCGGDDFDVHYICAKRH